MNHHHLFTTFALLIVLGAGCTSGTVTNTGTVPASETSNNPVSNVALDLSGRDLQNVPSEIFKRTELEELDLSKNRLTGALPGEIRFLQKLVALDVSENRMTGVPAEIGQLSQLRTLDLSNNQLTGLPLELGNLTQLQTLDLRGNVVSQQDLNAIRTKLTKTNILE